MAEAPSPANGATARFQRNAEYTVERHGFLAATYLLVVQVVKSWFDRRHALL